MLIDTHAHLYAKEFDSDRDAMLQNALRNGVEKIFLPNVDSASIDGMLALELQYPNHCFPMMGLHPCSVNETYKKELEIVEKWLFSRPFKGVGEIGIDLYWDKTFFEEQKIAFRQQIRWAKELNLPIIIHARDSLDVVLSIVEEEKDDKLKGIFHCFTGTQQQADRIIALEFMMGIGGVVTFKKADLATLLQNIPLDCIVLETDAPYLAPHPKRGKRNESGFLRYIAEKVCEIKGITMEELEIKTTANALKVFYL